MVKLEHNIQKVRKSVQDTQGRYVLNTRALARQAGREMRDNIRANVTPRAIGGVFEGYAMTSTLWKRVVSSKPQKKGGGWIVRVRVWMTGKVRKYARIHETGGIIRAKSAPYLTFKIRGHWVRVKEVRIRRKQYFAKGVQKTRQQMTIPRLAKKIWSRS